MDDAKRVAAYEKALGDRFLAAARVVQAGKVCQLNRAPFFGRGIDDNLGYCSTGG